MFNSHKCFYRLHGKTFKDLLTMCIMCGAYKWFPTPHFKSYCHFLSYWFPFPLLIWKRWRHEIHYSPNIYRNVFFQIKFHSFCMKFYILVVLTNCKSIWTHFWTALIIFHIQTTKTKSRDLTISRPNHVI